MFLLNAFDCLSFFQVFFLLSSFNFFFFYWFQTCSLYTIFHVVLSNIENFSHSPSLIMCLPLLTDFYPKDWCTYPGGTGLSSVIIYLKQLYSDCLISHPDSWLWFCQSCFFGLISFFRLKFFAKIFPPLRILEHGVLEFFSIYVEFLLNSKGCYFSSQSIWLFLCWLGCSLWSS